VVNNSSRSATVYPRTVLRPTPSCLPIPYRENQGFLRQDSSIAQRLSVHSPLIVIVMLETVARRELVRCVHGILMFAEKMMDRSTMISIASGPHTSAGLRALHSSEKPVDESQGAWPGRYMHYVAAVMSPNLLPGCDDRHWSEINRLG
jgi:hypothetical protein